MNRKSFYVALVISLALLLGIEAKAQTSTVGATITDSTGQAFAGGNWTVTYVKPFNQTQAPVNTSTGLPLTAAELTLSGSLNSSGAFAGVILTRTDFIAPSGGSWKWTVCSLATSPCFTYSSTITTGTLSLSSQLSAASGTIGTVASNDVFRIIPRAYKDNEVSGQAAGSWYYNLTNDSPKWYSTTNIWNSVLTSGSITNLTSCTSLTSFGDSIAAGYNVTTSWPQVIADQLGIPLTPLAVSGSQLADNTDQIMSVTPTTSSCYIIGGSVNEGGQYGTNTTQQNMYRAQLYGVLAWLGTPDSLKIKPNSSGVVTGGVWTTSSIYGGSLVQYTETVGATKTFNVYGSAIDIVSIAQTPNTSTFTITIDGVVKGTYSTNQLVNTYVGRSYALYGLRFSGLGEYNHAVIITAAAGTGVGNRAYFAFAVGNMGTTTRTGPLVYAMNIPELATSGYANQGPPTLGSDTVTGQLNEKFRQATMDMGLDGFNIGLVNIAGGGFYMPTIANVQADGIHPNQTGANLIAGAGREELSPTMTPRDKIAAKVFYGSGIGVIAGSLYVGGIVNDDAIQGDITAARTSATGALYLGLGTGLTRLSDTHFQIGFGKLLTSLRFGSYFNLEGNNFDATNGGFCAQTLTAGVLTDALCIDKSQTVTMSGQVSTVGLINPSTNITLANGANNDITPTSGQTFASIVGPTAVFNISGFVSGVDGKILRIYNTTNFAMTILNNNAASSAGNRLLTLTGADVTLRAGPSFATFIYKASQGVWILESSN